MSIYATRLDTLDGHYGRVIAYQGSHRQPDPDGTYRPSIDTAHIPGFCVPGREYGADDRPYGEWLRLKVGTLMAHATVLIDETAARALAADLLAWAYSAKVAPR